jgi:beta-hydroxylase
MNKDSPGGWEGQAMKWFLIAAWIVAGLYIHLRGKVRLPLKSQIVDHSTFMAPINAFMCMFSKVPRTPYLPLEYMPELAPLRRHWRVIRSEAEQLMGVRQLQTAGGEDDPNVAAFLTGGWKRFYLKWYDAIHPSAKRLCPQTFALLQSIPSIKVATFAELPAGGRLAPHRDPFAGWLRYHLGLATPNDDRCFIEVDGERHAWDDGEAMVFDETYIHWARNDTGSSRIVLLCDIERPMRFRWAQALNHFLGRTLMTATSPPNETGADTSVAGKLFRVLYYAGHYRRQLKSWNMAAYHVTMIGLVIGVAALLYEL